MNTKFGDKVPKAIQ